MQYPEFGLQALLTALMVFSGRWLVGGLHVIVLAFNVRLVFLQQHRVDVTGTCVALPTPVNGTSLFRALRPPLWLDDSSDSSGGMRCNQHIALSSAAHGIPDGPRVVIAEVFRELGHEKKMRMIKLGLYVLIFVVVIYKWALNDSVFEFDQLETAIKPLC